MLDPRRSGYGMFEEGRAMYDGDKEARIDVFLRPEDEKFGRADAPLINKDGLVEVWTQFAVENITWSIGELSALNFGWSSLSDPLEAPRRNVLQTDVNASIEPRRIDLNGDEIAELANPGRVHHTNSRSLARAALRS